MPRIYSTDPEQNAELAAEHAAEARVTGVPVSTYWGEDDYQEERDWHDTDDCDGDDEWTEEDEADIAAFRAEYEAMKATKRIEDMARADGLLGRGSSMADQADLFRMTDKDR
jgi:hypothetical protein